MSTLLARGHPGSAETFISSSGPNTLIGLGGNDTYYVNSADDVVIEAANGGIDIIEATIDYRLPANGNVERLYMLGSGLTGTGSDNADSLLSSGGPNILVGLDGDDRYYVNNIGDVVIEAANSGYDTVMAYVSFTLPVNVEALYMNGSGLTVTGSTGADTLLTLGANTLVGGDGNDTFVFFAGSADRATVADFDHSQADLLLFSGFGTEHRVPPSARSAIPTNGRFIPASMATTRRSHFRTMSRYMVGISYSCELGSGPNANVGNASEKLTRPVGGSSNKQ